MHRIDFTPVFRSTVGFDRMARLVDAAFQASEGSNQQSYPPYNIEKISEDSYQITMAIAGFSESDIDIMLTENSLSISGNVKKDTGDQQKTYLHRGIASRSFERRFDLADHIIVTGAEMENGLLNIDLIREIPEEKKPRKISIGSSRPKLSTKAA
ncbi:MAG: heat-shock protein [Rhodospirillaceae bacterium]|nr:heat-shock protein [Rhodospirillaceae bacterium]|tara:strand:+ start:282 stop:746 length:465 start_codon:yes stop_codon:yes gene_type:complete